MIRDNLEKIGDEFSEGKTSKKSFWMVWLVYARAVDGIHHFVHRADDWLNRRQMEMFSFLIIKEMVNVQHAQEARGASFALWATSHMHPYKLDGGTLHV